MSEYNRVANEWNNDANAIRLELSKTLLIVSATLLVFSTAIPVAIDTSNPPILYRIPWILILLSLLCGIGSHLMKARRLTNHASNLIDGRLGEHIRRSQTGFHLVSEPYSSEKWLVVLQPWFLILGLITTGVAVLW